MSEAARQHVSKYLAYFGPIGALGGFVSDVIQPLAPLSAYVFWVSLAASMGLIVGWLVLGALRPRLLPPLMLAKHHINAAYLGQSNQPVRGVITVAQQHVPAL